jgi:hypothetical protein
VTEQNSHQYLVPPSYLACTRKVPTATQTIALNALSFLYGKYLKRLLDNLQSFSNQTDKRI